MTFLNCDLCKTDEINSNLFDGEIEFPLKPIKGVNPFVMFVGQDPNGILFRWIINEILEPAGISLNNIYATNLIKCRFPNNQTPKLIAQKHGMMIRNFLSPFFQNCKKWLYSELEEVKPKIVISHGEPVHQMLIEMFNGQIPMKMKEAFGQVFPIEIFGTNAYYVPCIHVNSKSRKLYVSAWNGFIESLRHAVDTGGINWSKIEDKRKERELKFPHFPVHKKDYSLITIFLFS